MALFAFLIFAITFAIRTIKNSSFYIARQKNRPTRPRDVFEVAKQANLSLEEKTLLLKICLEWKVPNILRTASEKPILDKFLKNVWQELKAKNDERRIFILFSLRKKILSAFAPIIEIKNSKTISVGVNFSLKVSQGSVFSLKYSERALDGMYLEMSDSLVKCEEKPIPLRKIFLTFINENGIAYRLESRVIRYQKNREGREQMVVSHTDKISLLEKRQTDRFETSADVVFSAVRVENRGGVKNPKITYTPLENEYHGILLDVSSGGCKLLTALPIKPNQYIFVKGNLENFVHLEAFGLILRYSQRKDKRTVLHIRFVKISHEVSNRIAALACGWYREIL